MNLQAPRRAERVVKMNKVVKFSDIEREAKYLAKVFRCEPEDVFTKEEIKEAQEKGFISICIY